MASAVMKASPSTALRPGSFAKGARDETASLGCPASEARPSPCNIECNADPSLYRIAMNVAQLFDKLRVTSNVEIVIPFLPEMLWWLTQVWFWLE
jgi:hypothetical protein